MMRRRLGLAAAVVLLWMETGAAFTVPSKAAMVSTEIIQLQSTVLRDHKANEFDMDHPPASSIKKRKQRAPNVRMQVFAFLNLPTVEVVAGLAVFLSSFLVAMDTLDSLPTPLEGIDTHDMIENALTIFNIVFAVEFFLRWYAAGNFKAIYLTKPLAILDIGCVLVPLVLATVMPGLEYAFGDNVDVSMASIWQFDSTGLQNLLLLRILRLRRVLTDIKTFGRFQAALGFGRAVRPYQLQLARVLLSIFTLLSVASGLIYTFENEVNPNIHDYFSALYFGLTTLTTVGFGDIVPVTAEGRIVVCLSILAGIAVIPAQTANLVDAILQFNEERKKGGPRVTITPQSQNKLAEKPIVVSSTALRESATNGEPEPNERIEPFVGWLGKCCLECEATDHREDASYCWSCGSKMD